MECVCRSRIMRHGNGRRTAPREVALDVRSRTGNSRDPGLTCGLLHEFPMQDAAKSPMATMLRVEFVHADGSRETHAAARGETVMDCALDHGVRGIRAQCG